MIIINKKFIFYSPGDRIYEIHTRREQFEIPRAFAKSGYDSTILSGVIDVPQDEEINFFQTNNLFSNPLRIVNELGNVIRKFRNEKPDIVMIYHNNPLIPLFVVSYMILSYINKDNEKKKIVWALKSDWLEKRKPGQHIFDRLFRIMGIFVNQLFLKYVLVETQCAINSLSRFISGKKLILSSNFFPSSQYYRNKYENGKREHTVLTVARISKQKGIHIMLDAFSRLFPQFPDWKVHIIGPVEDTEYYKELLEVLTAKGLESHVSFLGPLYGDDLKEEYFTASIFCLPSIYETFGIARYEAAMAGIPVITSDAGCGKYLTQLSMLVYRYDKIDELTELLRNLMVNEVLRNQVSSNQQEKLKNIKGTISEFITLMGE